MTQDDIHFLYNEIEEKINKEVEEVLFELKNPLASKRAWIITKFTEALFNAYIEKRKEFLKQEKLQEEKIYEKLKDRYSKIQQTPKQIRIPEQLQIQEEKIFRPSIQESAVRPKKVFVQLITNYETNENIAYAEIEEDSYRVNEPEMNEQDLNLLKKLEEKFKGGEGILSDKNRLLKEIRKISNNIGIEFNDDDLLKFRYYLIRDLAAFGVIEPFLHDKSIQKIICERENSEITIIRENSKFKTNIFFRTKEEINNIVRDFAEKTFQKVSEEDPILDATFKDFRIHATLGTDILPARFIMIRQN